MKRLVVCCDGTWSTLANNVLTNVALTARSIAARDADGNAQIVYYDDGVGVEVGRMDMFSAAFGRGLDYKVQEAYEFLTLNYEPGDQLYFFGYSRGAYTVRSLTGLVRKCGILKREHADKTAAALKLYRTRDVTADAAEAVEFRNQYAFAWPKLDSTGMQAVMGGTTYDLRVCYVGVWDTVGALGIPRKVPFAGNVNKNFEFHDCSLSRAVLNARQAVAIDERRDPFAPALWTNLEAFNTPENKRVEQLWFPGNHGCVGGAGCDGGKLSGASLDWVLQGAERAGLVLDRSPNGILARATSDLDVINADLWEKKFDLSNMVLGMSWRKGLDNLDNVHENALMRWKATSNYRPRPLAPFRSRLKALRKEYLAQLKAERRAARRGGGSAAPAEA